MAMGDVYNSNKNDQKNNYSPTVYSGYKVSRTDGIDPSQLSVTFWNGTMKISIAPKKDSPNGDIAYDHDNAANIYLSHTKARIFAEEIREFMKGDINSAGVDTAKGLITISNGKEYGKNSKCIIIRTFDLNNNTVDSSYAYEFKSQYHYAIRNFTDKSMDNIDKIYYDDIEIWQLVTVLEEYYKAMTNAQAYAVIDQSKYNNSRINTKLDSIATKLGIDFKTGNNSNGNRKSVFADRDSNGFKAGSMADLAPDDDYIY